MREARIILPDHPYTSFASHGVRNALLSQFGGYTEVHGHGAWRDGNGKDHKEPVRIWYVNTGAHPYPEETLRELAARVGLMADQECVYVVMPGGEVELVPSETEEEEQERRIANSGIVGVGS